MQIALHKVLLKIVLFAGFLSALVVMVPQAKASYGTRGALETIGVSTGIGAVLGLSTISFYETPTRHFQNVLIGAGAGLIVGLGVASYLLANSSDEDEINPEELVIPPKPPVEELKKGGEKKIDSAIKNKTSSLKKKFSAPADLLAMRRLNLSERRSYEMPGWSIAFEVLELRF